MKKSLLFAALIAASLSLAPTLALATEPNVSGTTGDLILGFQLSGHNDLEVDLGPLNTFLDAASAFPVTFGLVPADQAGAGGTVTSLNADLTANFGAGWNSSSSLLWGAIAAEGNTIYLTVDSNNPVPQRPATTGANVIESNVNGSLIDDGLLVSPSTVNSTKAASIPTTTDDAFTTFDPSTNAFQSGLNIEEAPGDTATGSDLDLYELVPSHNGGGNGVDVGSFALNGSGDLTFTPAAVPEPSTWISIVSGTLFLGLFRLRRRARNS